MRARANVLSGIVNGIDYDEYNPETDKRIANNYNQITFRKEKWKNKVALQKELGLTEDKGKFMIGLVSRLTDQKGFDLVAWISSVLKMYSLLFLVLEKKDTRICSDIMTGNIMTEYLPTYITQKICHTKYMLHVMHSLCHHYSNHADFHSL